MRLFLLACLYILASFGFAFAVGYAKISLPLRAWLLQVRYQRLNRATGNYDWYESRFVPARQWTLDLLQCPACLGFWIGVGAALVDALTAGAAGAALLGLDRMPLWAFAFVLGQATAASNFILGVVTRLIEVH